MKEWFEALFAKMGEKVLTNRDFYALIDQTNTEFGKKIDPQAHSKILARLEKGGFIEVAADTSRKGWGREKPVVIQLISKTGKPTPEEKEKPRAKRTVKTKKFSKPSKAICERIYKILQLAKENPSAPLGWKKMASWIGAETLTKTQLEGWINHLKRYGDIDLKYTIYFREGVKFLDVYGKIREIGEKGNAWYGEKTFDPMGDLGMTGFIPATLVAKKVVKKEDISTPVINDMEKDIIYYSAGLVRSNGAHSAVEAEDLMKTLRGMLQLDIRKSDFLAIIQKAKELSISEGGPIVRVGLQDGEKSWQEIKKKFGPASRAKKVILARLQQTDEDLKKFGYLEVEKISEISGNDGIYKITITDDFIGYESLRKLLLTLRGQEKILNEEGLVDTLNRENIRMFARYKNADKKYRIETEDWLGEEK